MTSGPHELNDGIYIAVLKDGVSYRVEKANNDWYFSDGTGCREKIKFPFEIVSTKPATTDLFPRRQTDNGSQVKKIAKKLKLKYSGFNYEEDYIRETCEKCGILTEGDTLCDRCFGEQYGD